MTTTAIRELRQRWQDAAAQGDHATSYSITQEIAALEHQAAVDAVQRKAKAEAAKIAEAVEDAAATLRAIDNHRGIRADYGKLLADLEATTGRVVDLLARARVEFPRVAHSFPRFEDHKEPAMQSAYREALGPLPTFDPLRVGFRISECLTRLRMEAARGVGDIAGIADPARF